MIQILSLLLELSILCQEFIPLQFFLMKFQLYLMELVACIKTVLLSLALNQNILTQSILLPFKAQKDMVLNVL